MAANFTGWAYTVALGVFAYDEGGAAAVGLVFLLVTIPPGFAAPFVGALADRYPRRRVMVATTAVRVVAVAGAAAAVFADAGVVVVFALAVVAALAGRAFFPAQAAALPGLARSPDELAAANVVSSTVESIGMFAGPALGGLLLAATNVETVFVAASVVLALAVLLLLRIRGTPDTSDQHEEAEADGWRSVLGGFAAIRGDRRLAALVALYCSQTVVAGVLDVLIVVTALDALDLGEAWVGWLNSAVGVGGLAGAAVALALAARSRLAADLAVGMLLWSLPLVALAAVFDPVVALVALLLVGIGNTLGDVSAITLLQRVVPDRVLGRVFGVVEGLTVATIGLGALVAPAAIALVGVRGTFAAAGVLLVLCTALLWPLLRTLDRARPAGEEVAGLLDRVPFIGVLPLPVRERLAAQAGRESFPRSAVVVRAGDPGDTFYVVERGEVEVQTEAGVRTLGPGGYFGEIALLRDVPRTATVVAQTDVELVTLGREPFVSAVTGHVAGHAAAGAVVASRLGGMRTA